MLSEVHSSRSVESFKKLLASERFKRYLSQLDMNACHEGESGSCNQVSSENDCQVSLENGRQVSSENDGQVSSENDCQVLQENGRQVSSENDGQVSSENDCQAPLGNDCHEFTKEQVCDFKGDDSSEFAGELEGSLLSARDQFAESLPDFVDRKGLIDFAEREIAKLINKLEKEPVRDPKPRPAVRGSQNASRKSLRRKYFGRLQEIYNKDRKRASGCFRS